MKLRRFVLIHKIALSAVVFALVGSSIAAAYTIPAIFDEKTGVSSDSSTSVVQSRSGRTTGSAVKDTSADSVESSGMTKSDNSQESSRTSSPGMKDVKSATQSSAKSGKISIPPSPTTTQETPEQLYAREYKNLGQAYYSLSANPIRSESAGYIYYTVTLNVSAFDAATFGYPTMFAELVPSTPNRYSCVNPVGTTRTFVYGSGGNMISISCQIRACPECYAPGGPLPYYGAFTVEAGGFTSNGTPTGRGSRSYDLAPGYDKPS